MKSKVLSTACLLLGAMSALAQDVPAMLKAADHFRMSAENLEVDTLVQVMQVDGTPDKERRYKVFVQANRQSLVLMQSPAEKGQKLLMLGDDFWLLMPDSQRPLRITPMQKLLGDASTGDIANLRWADDYNGQTVNEERCEPPRTASQAAPAEASYPCLHLSLNARRKGVSYQRIELWVGKARLEPLKADLYVLSDKLAKQAVFVFDKSSAPSLVTEMVLTDQVSNHKITQVRYLSRKPRQVAAEWLNPMFLVRNPPLD